MSHVNQSSSLVIHAYCLHLFAICKCSMCFHCTLESAGELDLDGFHKALQDPGILEPLDICSNGVSRSEKSATNG